MICLARYELTVGVKRKQRSRIYINFLWFILWHKNFVSFVFISEVYIFDLVFEDSWMILKAKFIEETPTDTIHNTKLSTICYVMSTVIYVKNTSNQFSITWNWR